MNYEINFLILQSQTENIVKIREQVKKLITAHGGEITDNLVYQKRKLAYEINHEQYGFYTVYRFDLEDGEKLKNLTETLNLEKGLTRYIIVKSSEIPELQKEIGKAPKTEAERKAEAMKKASNQSVRSSKYVSGQKTDQQAGKVSKKVLSEIGRETTKTTSLKTETKVLADKKDFTSVAKEKIDTEKKDEKKSTAKEIRPEADQSSSKKPEKKKEEISMEDLDKKLDEILNI